MQMMQSETIEALVQALVKVQAGLEPVKFNQENPFFNSEYADLTALREASRPLLSEHGLVIIQTFDNTDGGNPVIITTLAHISGQWIRGRLALKPTESGVYEKDGQGVRKLVGKQVTPQGVGSALTYGRRYSWAAILGLTSEEDDDANVGSQGAGARGGSQITAQRISWFKKMKALKGVLNKQTKSDKAYKEVLKRFNAKTAAEVKEADLGACANAMQNVLKDLADKKMQEGQNGSE